MHDVKAMEMGANWVRFKAEVEFDGEKITNAYLKEQNMEELFRARDVDADCV